MNLDCIAELNKEDDEEVVETDEVNCNESVSSDADTHEDEDIEWLKSLDEDDDYHNNESKGMLENFTSYYIYDRYGAHMSDK